MMRLGQMLLDEQLIRPDALQEALAEQQACGCRLGGILISKGKLNHLALYQVLAKHHGLPFADLLKDPPARALLNPEDRQHYMDAGIIPWKDGVYAVTDPVTARATLGGALLAVTSPMDIAYTVQHYFHEETSLEAREKLWRHTPQHSAKTLLAGRRGKSVAALMMLGLFASLLHTQSAALWFVLASVFYAVTIGFKALLVSVGLFSKTRQDVPFLAEKDLPVYSVLVPLYHEAAVVPRLIAALRALDYPKSKLDIKLIVEASDDATLHAIKAEGCERYFQIIQIPPSLPQTKPKACNYALSYARGEFVTIYDAEDRPDALQLKKAAALFARYPDIACVQARLLYYNREENPLTHMFALEYGIWFDFLLAGLQRLKLPIPLGGTSNHIRRAVLQQCHAWDPYNVTEDADLGIRLAAHGYHTHMLDSFTGEEATLSVGAWLSQRSRWIKGYMQTYLVYMRRPGWLWRRLGAKGFMAFQLFIGAPCLVFLISPLMWGAWAYSYVWGWDALAAYGPGVHYVTAFNLWLGFGLQAVLAAMVVVKHQWWKTVRLIPLFPFYWGLHSIASVKALWQLFTKPHWWEKTTHGVSRF